MTDLNASHKTHSKDPSDWALERAWEYAGWPLPSARLFVPNYVADEVRDHARLLDAVRLEAIRECAGWLRSLQRLDGDEDSEERLMAASCGPWLARKLESLLATPAREKDGG